MTRPLARRILRAILMADSSSSQAGGRDDKWRRRKPQLNIRPAYDDTCCPRTVPNNGEPPAHLTNGFCGRIVPDHTAV